MSQLCPKDLIGEDIQTVLLFLFFISNNPYPLEVQNICLTYLYALEKGKCALKVLSYDVALVEKKVGGFSISETSVPRFSRMCQKYSFAMSSAVQIVGVLIMQGTFFLMMHTKFY